MTLIQLAVSKMGAVFKAVEKNSDNLRQIKTKQLVKKCEKTIEAIRSQLETLNGESLFDQGVNGVRLMSALFGQGKYIKDLFRCI